MRDRIVFLVVDYAPRFGWGVVVDKRNDKDLLQGIKMAASQPMAKEIVLRGYSVAKMHHDITVLRMRVLERVRAAAQGYAA